MATPTELAREAKQHSEILRTEFDLLKQQIDLVDLQRLREQVAVLENQVAELKRSKEESEKRHWQFVYIFAGAVASLLVTVIVQLVLAWAKK